MHPSYSARARAVSLPQQIPTLRLALAVALAMAMVTLSMVVGVPPSDASGPTVVITDSLSPKSVSITPGTTVTWVNRDDKEHRLRTQDGGIEFDSKDLEPGDRWSHTFRDAGTASYHDQEADEDTAYHGKVVVGQQNGGASAAGATGAAGVAGATGAAAGPASAAPSLAKVTIGGTFSPVKVTVSAGGVVTWTNQDDKDHTVTATDGSFDSGPIKAGGSWSHRFSGPGTFAYYCMFHTDMRGTVSVPDRSGAAPPPKSIGAGAAGTPGASAAHSPAAGAGAAAPGTGVKAASHRVAISDSAFSPAVLSARVGDTVTWVNGGKMPHTVTGGPWDAQLMPGKSFTTVLRATGTIDYVCTYHDSMRGTVKISPAPAGTKLSPPSAADRGSGLPAPAAAPAPAKAPGAQQHTVTISGNAYSPDPLVARVGDRVTWVNKDPMPHTVTGGPWNAMIAPGGQFSAVLGEPGTVNYVCTLHPGMGGSVQVKPAAAGTKVPPATPAAPVTPEKHDAAPAPKAEASAETHVVTIKDFTYSPQTLEARVGDTVTFVNKDSAPHTATSKDKSFDSGKLEQGDEFTLKLTKAGTLEYLCTYHPNMVGKIVVRAAAASPTSAHEDVHEEPAMVLTAGRVAGLGSGWLGLLLFLAGTQLRTRLRTRR